MGVHYLESMKQYFNIILAGLASTSHTTSATIGALARLVYEFSGKFAGKNFDWLHLQQIC